MNVILEASFNEMLDPTDIRHSQIGELKAQRTLLCKTQLRFASGGFYSLVDDPAALWRGLFPIPIHIGRAIGNGKFCHISDGDEGWLSGVYVAVNDFGRIVATSVVPR